jgi:ubiquinone/menaquinone biosynthesis methyltransferase
MGQVHPSRESVQAIDAHGRQVQAMFSDIAHGYDRANRVMSLGTDVRWRRRAVLKLAADRIPHDILDLCAGTLDSSKEIHAAFPEATIIGGDFSQGMLETGARTLNAKEREHIQPVAMDAHSLPLGDRSQDAIFCAFGVRNLSDLRTAVREQARVLRPGGRVVVIDFFRPHAAFTRIFHGVYNSTVLPAVGWMMTGNLAAYRYLPRSISNFCTTQDFAQLLTDEGFVGVEVEALTFGVATIVSAQRPGSTS